MGRKLVTKLEHVRRMGNEGPEAWQSRQAIAAACLQGKIDWPGCRFRLYQVKGDPETGQIPDFTLVCQFGLQWAIEIGVTGSERTRNLEAVGFNVVKVGRGQGFDFNRKIAPLDGCPSDCDMT